ncbi:hypothetical protein, partial [Klebsiella michiganensis]
VIREPEKVSATKNGCRRSQYLPIRSPAKRSANREKATPIRPPDTVPEGGAGAPVRATGPQIAVNP